MMRAALAPPPASGPVLRDIHLPPDPSWWPPAPGWWALAALLLIVLLLLGRAAWRWRRGVRQRNRVLAEVDALNVQYLRDADSGAFAGGLHQLLRRVARMRDASAVQASGDAWRAHLAQVPVDAATLQQLLALETSMYRPQPFDAAATTQAVRRWLRMALNSKRRRRPHV